MRPTFLLLLGLATSSPATFAQPASLATVQEAATQKVVPGPTEKVVHLVRLGRDLIDLGFGQEARTVLERADLLDEGRLRTRMWLARALVEMEYLNDALDMIDDLASKHTGPEIDYLYGMAFTYKARKYIADGVGGGMIGMHFQDSVAHLLTATKADSDRFADAYLPLAEAAWHSQDLKVARRAAKRAVEVSGGGLAERFQLGEVAFSQYVVANSDEALSHMAAGHWHAAFDAFQDVGRSLGSAEDLGFRAAAFRKCGDLQVWRGEAGLAVDEYARAMGMDPSSVAYDQLLGSLGNELFLKSLEAGEQAFAAQHGESAKDLTSDATLLWWLGWSRFSAGAHAESIDAFERSFAKWPDYTNCKWYIALAHYHTGDVDSAINSLVEHIQLDLAGLVNSMQSDLGHHLSVLDGMIGHCFQQGRTLEAGRLSAVQANSAPDVTRYWNNVGLFYRDAGDGMRGAEGEDAEVRKQYYEKSLEGYERALGLEPQNPALLNDTAVVLHYNLQRDLDRAQEMYRLAHERAVIELAREDLSADLRELYSIAKRDSANNLALLEEYLRRKAAASAPLGG